MSGIIKTLFGGGETKSQSTSTPVDLQAPEYQALRSPFSNVLQGLIYNGGAPTYQGPLTTPIGGNEQSVLDFLQGNTGAGSRNAGYLSDVISGKYLNSNPFLDAAIRAAQRPTLEGLTETLTRALPGRFTIGGQFVQPQGSSAFDRAAAIATRGAANAIGDIATNISFPAYQAERQLQQGAVPLQQQEIDTTIKNLQAQALPRLIQEQGIDRALELFKQQTASLLQLLQTIGAVTAPVVANRQQSTSEGSYTKGIFAPIGLSLGGGGSAPA